MNESRWQVGQEVFVVHGHRRLQRTETRIIEKVGRKFGYLSTSSSQEAKFDIATGRSVHSDRDCNAYANGRGFDVYASEIEYRMKQRAEERHKQLANRLLNGVGRLEPLSPETVEKIHAILDEEGLFEA